MAGLGQGSFLQFLASTPWPAVWPAVCSYIPKEGEHELDHDRVERKDPCPQQQRVRGSKCPIVVIVSNVALFYHRF